MQILRWKTWTGSTSTEIHDLQKGIGCEVVDWIQLAQGRVQWWAPVRTVMNIWVPYMAQNFLTSWVTITYSISKVFHGIGWLVRILLVKLIISLHFAISFLLTLGGGGWPSAAPLHCPDDSRSTCSLSRTHKDARASHNVGVRKQSDGMRCESSSFVRLRMFSATAPFVTFAQASDSLPWNNFTQIKC